MRETSQRFRGSSYKGPANRPLEAKIEVLLAGSDRGMVARGPARDPRHRNTDNVGGRK